MHFTCAFEMKVPAKRRAALYELLALANDRLWIGHFAIDPDDGMPVFRYAVLLRGAPGASTESLEDMVELGPAEIPPKRLHTYRLCQFMAGRAGLPLRFPPRHPFRSLDALRLLSALDGRADAVRKAFEFVWAEGRDPGDPAERDALCARLGVDYFETFIAEQGAKDRLRAWIDEAIDAGVFGVPTFRVDAALFWGVDAMPMGEAFLNDPGMLGSGEMARLAQLPHAMRRKLS